MVEVANRLGAQSKVPWLLLSLGYIVDQLFESHEPQDVRLWLFARQKLLHGQISTELLQKDRADEVMVFLGRMRDGVFL